MKEVIACRKSGISCRKYRLWLYPVISFMKATAYQYVIYGLIP